MLATDLLPPNRDLPAGSAGRWIRALIAEAEALQDFDADLLPVDDTPATNARAKQLRAAWEKWASEAEKLLMRIEGDPSLDLLECQKLQGMIRIAQGLARRDLADIRHRQRQVEDGHIVTREEALRELGLPRRR